MAQKVKIFKCFLLPNTYFLLNSTTPKDFLPAFKFWYSFIRLCDHWDLHNCVDLPTSLPHDISFHIYIQKQLHNLVKMHAPVSEFVYGLVHVSACIFLRA